MNAYLSALAGPAPPKGFVHAYRMAKVVIANRVRHFDVPSDPSFDTESAAYFRRQLESTRNYLEYGSGGSTILAHKLVNNLVSVDSDAHFLADVRRKLMQDDSQAVTKLIHANIGLTQQWGMPVFTKPTRRRIRRWETYPRAPWSYYRALGLEPDLILVDGRFRVACMLESLLSVSRTNQCPILCDDYASRPHYHVVEQFAHLSMAGRMAVLRAKESLDRIQCRRLVRQYCADPR
ncbi:MAG: hypothetical protein ACREVV_06930 [Steroidobacteraceae bacterium]